MAIIDREGLFKGKRLRKCSAAARWRWPYLFLMSNGYARIELDYDSIADEFSSFRKSAPTPDELRETFAEFRANHLLFVYTVNDQEWGQWDCRRTWLKDYKTTADSGSPQPPENEYQRWLIEQHGQGWREFHWSKEAIDGAFDQSLPKPLPSVSQSFPAGRYGVGGGGGTGEGKERTASDFNPTEAAMGYCHTFSVVGSKNYENVRQAIELEAKGSTESPSQIATSMIAARHSFRTIPKIDIEFDGGPVWFVSSGKWKEPESWRKATAAPPAPPKKDPQAERVRLQDLESELKEKGRQRRDTERKQGGKA